MVLPVRQIPNKDAGMAFPDTMRGRMASVSTPHDGAAAVDAATASAPNAPGRLDMLDGNAESGGSAHGGQPCVCLFSALYAPSVGGVEGYTEHLAHALARMGCRVIVVAMNTHDREGYVHESAANAARAAHAPTEQSAVHPAEIKASEEKELATVGPASASAQAEPVAGASGNPMPPPEASPCRTEPTTTGDGVPLVEVVRLPCRPLLGGRYPVPRKNAEYRALWKWLESQRINYVVVNTRFYLLSEMGVEFAQVKGIVPLVIEHGSAHLTMGNPVLDQAVQAVEHGLTKRLAVYPAAFYGVSKRACDWLGHFGIATSGVLPNAIDADAFAALATTESPAPGSHKHPEEDNAAADAKVHGEEAEWGAVREGELGKANAAANRTSSKAGNAADTPYSFRGRFGLSPDTFVVAFVGRLVPEKGIESLVEAVELMKAQQPMALLVAGDGPFKAAFAKKVEANNGEAAAANRIIVLGSLPKDQVAALLAQADVLCLPSRSEGFATVLLEASAVGTPCIATPVGGTDELFPTAGFGVVIPDAEPHTIAGALEAAAADPNGWQAMGQRAADRVRSQFTWQTTAESLLAACQQANER